MHRAILRKFISQSTVDGPGNRVAIFFQGCNIRCAYCHNPETQDIIHEEQCHGSCDVKMVGVADIMAEIKKCIPFVRGITISGGECMLQAEFVEELFAEVKVLGLTCLIDSNGTIPFSRYPRLLELCDGVMLDVKAWEPTVYKQLTGAANDNIVKDNLQLLLQLDKLTEVRIICLPDEAPVTTDVENILHHLAETPCFASKRIPVKLIRFRPHGVIGIMSESPATSDPQMERYTSLAQSLGLAVRPVY